MSRWYPVYRGEDGQLRRDETNQRPNQGCAWECEPGYVAIRMPGSGIELCVDEGGAMAKRYAPGAPP